MTAEQRTESSNYLWMDIPLDPFPNLSLSHLATFFCGSHKSCGFTMPKLFFYFIFKDLFGNELLENNSLGGTQRIPGVKKPLAH